MDATTQNIQDTYISPIYNFGFIMRKEIDDYEARDSYMYFLEGDILRITDRIIEYQKSKKIFSKFIIEIELSPPQYLYTGIKFQEAENDYLIKMVFRIWKKKLNK